MARAAAAAFVACLLATCLLADMVAAEQAAAQGFSLAQGSAVATGYRKLLLFGLFGEDEEEKGPRVANTETGQRINNAIDKLSYGWRVIKFGYNLICLFAPCSPLSTRD